MNSNPLPLNPLKGAARDVNRNCILRRREGPFRGKGAARCNFFFGKEYDNYFILIDFILHLFLPHPCVSCIHCQPERRLSFRLPGIRFLHFHE